MYQYTDLDYQIINLIKAYGIINTIGSVVNGRIVLGGEPGPSGGTGGPWTSPIGQLPQTLVCYDTSEQAIIAIPVSGVSLLDNLNRIRSGWAIIPSGVNPEHYTVTGSGNLIEHLQGIDDVLASVGHDPVTISGTTTITLTLVGQKLSGVVIPSGIDHNLLSGLQGGLATERYHMTNAQTAALHPIVTLAADADVLLGLSTQELNLDNQSANLVFAGPSGGAAADPTFRILVAADIPTQTLTATSPITLSAATSVIAAGAITIAHATTAGNIHLPTSGSANQILKNSGTSGTGAWGTVTESSGALAAITTIGMSGQLTNTLAIGNAPFVITSTTKVLNLNVEQVDSLDAQTLTATSPITLSASCSVLAAAGITIAHATTTGNIHLPTGGATGQIITYGAASGTGAWTTATYPATTTAYQLLVSTATSVIGGLAVGTTGKVLVGATGAVPVWSTPTFPNASATTGKIIISDGTNWVASTPTFANTYAVSTILYASSADVVTGLATANSGVLVTGATGIPSIATDIPTAVTIGTKYIYRAAGTDVPVADGGTGASTLTDGGLLVGAGTGVIEVLAVGLTTQILVGGGAGTNPAWGTDLPTAVTIGTAYVYRAGGTDVAAADISDLGANPSASVGLAAVNGAATTYIRSDGAPALSQAIAPTWTGKHLYQPSVDAVDVFKIVNNAGTDIIFQVDTTNKCIGIGIAPSASYRIYANTLATDTTYYGMGVFLYPVITASATKNNYAIFGTVREIVNATKTNSGSAYGMVFQALRNAYSADADDDGTLALLAGLHVDAGNYSANVSANPQTTIVRGISVTPYIFKGDIGTYYGLLLLNASGIVGNITNYYAIYQQDVNAKNYFAGNTGFGTTSPASLLDISSITGGILTLSRADTSATAADVIGTIQWWNNDTQLTTQNIYANIIVTATSTVTTDAAAGTMKFNVTGSTAGGSPIEHMAFIPTTVAKIGFFGVAPVVRPTALTTALTTITAPAYTPDTAIQAVTQTTPFGFVNANEGNTVINSVANLMTRIAELETKLQGLGLLT